MPDKFSRREAVTVTARRLFHFVTRVIKRFLGNNGILLAGGVGYNVLLSAVPMFALLGVVLTGLVEEQQLLRVMSVQAQRFAPAHADLLTDAVRAFMESRDVIGLTSIPVLLFFSSFAFRMLENSIGIIFHRPDVPKRHAWVSALLPYGFILVLGLGLLALTILFALANAFYEDPVFFLYILSFVSVFILFSAFYKILPTVRIATRRAVIGGLVAAVLWEATRLLLMYYFIGVSLVGVVYGSLATIIVLLLSLEIGAVILLLGAQVIAELENSARAGQPWYVEVDDGGPRLPGTHTQRSNKD